MIAHHSSKRRQLTKAGHSSSNSITNTRSNTSLSAIPVLVVSAHGRFMHPNAAALGDFFSSDHHGAAKGLATNEDDMFAQKFDRSQTSALPEAPRDGAAGMRAARDDPVKQMTEDAGVMTNGRCKTDAQYVKACLVNKMMANNKPK